MTDPISRLNAALLGRYVIEGALGAGGMATVYLADDLKHERKVALKVLKPELAAVVGAERFLAEIKTTANLQHPHILPLFDSGEADGFLFYVMPHIDGETLAQRLERENQLPVDEAVRIAVAVANALQTAHEAGVIHRDIKPGNILLSRGEPLVADFGIALAVGAAGGSRLTETGLSVGTPYYMSPEQATGDQHVGPASDTYSLACVLYEMLVGEPPYLGNTAQAVLGKIIQGQPVSATASRKAVTPNVDAAIRRALEKVPADRFATAADFAAALGDASFRHGGGVDAVGAAGGSRWVTVAHGAVTVGLAALAAWALLRPEPAALPMRFTLGDDARGVMQAPMSLAVAPDGAFMVLNTLGGVASGGMALATRRFDEAEGVRLAGGEGGMHPSVSPDGAEIAFVNVGGGEIWVVSASGGAPRQVAGEAICCVSWERDGFIYYPARDGSTRRVSPAGGAGPETVLPPTSGPSQIAGFPHLTRSGKALLMLAGFASAANGQRIDAVRLSDGTRRTVVEGAVSPAFHTETGHLVYVSTDGRLLAAPFDEDELRVTGTPLTLAEGLVTQPFATLSASETGMMVTLQGSLQGAEVLPVWVDRDGRTEIVDPEWSFGFVSPTGNRGISLSPDGTRVAASVFEGSQDGDIYVKLLPAGPFSRLTTSPGGDTRPRWTPDGDSITYVGTRQAGPGGLVIRADLAATAADSLGPAGVFEVQVAPGGEWLAVRGTEGSQSMDLSAVRRDGQERYDLPTEFIERAISLSPDGRWIAYESNETGRTEVYVRSFPDLTRTKRPISASGGSQPLWGRTGRELFYVDAEDRMIAVSVETAPDLRIGSSTVLFQLPEDIVRPATNEFYTLFDVDVDDQRFLMLRTSDEEEQPELLLLINALESLKGG